MAAEPRPETHGAPTTVGARPEVVAHAEAAVAAREAALLDALDDASFERIEVLAFAEDVRARLLGHLEQENPEIRAALARLARLEPPSAERGAYEARLARLRAEALRAREALADAVASELESVYAAIDEALAEVKSARDVMIRGCRRRPTSEASGLAPSIRLEQTSVHEALPVSSPTRREARPSHVEEAAHAPPETPVVRRNLRRRLETDVTFHSESNFYAGFSSNLSDGGLFVATHEDLPIGTELALRFTLPGGEEVEATVAVRWRRPAQPDLPGGVGVEFIELPPLARDAIHRFMRRRDPIFHEV